jgi:hypothetical protein
VSELCVEKFLLLLVYSHRRAFATKKRLSAKRSILKPCNFKTSPITPDFLYNFLTLLQSRN